MHNAFDTCSLDIMQNYVKGKDVVLIKKCTEIAAVCSDL